MNGHKAMAITVALVCGVTLAALYLALREDDKGALTESPRAKCVALCLVNERAFDHEVGGVCYCDLTKSARRLE